MNEDQLRNLLFEIDYWKQINADISRVNDSAIGIMGIVEEMVLDAASTLDRGESTKLLNYIEKITDQLESQLENIKGMQKLTEGRLLALDKMFNK